MCGRYVVKTQIKTIAKMHRVFDAPLFEPRYNVAPTQTVPIVRAKDAGRESALVRWGLIPAWAKDPKIGYRLINARADTVASKPSFRSAFKRRRCLVPADGFYEWQRVSKGKQPFYIHREDEELFAFAGLWEVWEPRNQPACAAAPPTERHPSRHSVHRQMADHAPQVRLDLELLGPP